MANKARHAFGALENVSSALETGVINAYDILFLKDSSGKPYIGWIDKDGNQVVVNDEKIVHVEELPTENGDKNVIYIYNNEGYIWDVINEKCVPMSKSSDLTLLETQVSELETQMTTKVDESFVNAKIEAAIEEMTSVEVVEF